MGEGNLLDEFGRRWSGDRGKWKREKLRENVSDINQIMNHRDESNNHCTYYSTCSSAKELVIDSESFCKCEIVDFIIPQSQHSPLVR